MSQLFLFIVFIACSCYAAKDSMKIDQYKKSRISDCKYILSIRIEVNFKIRSLRGIFLTLYRKYFLKQKIMFSRYFFFILLNFPMSNTNCPSKRNIQNEIHVYVAFLFTTSNIISNFQKNELYYIYLCMYIFKHNCIYVSCNFGIVSRIELNLNEKKILKLRYIVESNLILCYMAEL